MPRDQLVATTRNLGQRGLRFSRKVDGRHCRTIAVPTLIANLRPSGISAEAKSAKKCASTAKRGSTESSEALASTLVASK
jgi:hypothetical protein